MHVYTLARARTRTHTHMHTLTHTRTRANTGEILAIVVILAVFIGMSVANADHVDGSGELPELCMAVTIALTMKNVCSGHGLPASCPS